MVFFICCDGVCLRSSGRPLPRCYVNKNGAAMEYLSASFAITDLTWIAVGTNSCHAGLKPSTL